MNDTQTAFSIAEWLNTPVIILVVIAIAGALIGVGKWIGNVNSDRTNFKEFMKEIRDDIRKIKDDVQQIFRRLPPSPVNSRSPLQLNDLGERIAEDLEARTWALSLADDLVDRIGAMEDYEIDAYCQKYVQDLGEAWKRKVMSSAYRFGLTKENIETVLAVVLRNVVLERLQR